ncbi:MAG: CinA family protein [Woeseiaceae bacterium]
MSEFKELLKLAERVVEALLEKKLCITTVESCTGGGMANYITNIPRASEVIKGARVTYSTEEKISLGVSESVIDKYTVYSKETALAMARAGIWKSTRSEVSVGITGSFTREDMNNTGSKVGEIYIAVVYGDEVICKKICLTNNAERCVDKDMVIKNAFNMVLEIIEA